MDRPTRQTSQVPWTARVAGVAVALVGVANAAFGMLGLTTGLVRLEPAAAVGLLVLGAITVVIAIPVWRGSRSGVTIALAVFGLLLVVQLGELVSSPGAENPAPRLVVLAVVLVALGAARWHLWRSARG
jgi:phosphatidylserine synthase